MFGASADIVERRPLAPARNAADLLAELARRSLWVCLAPDGYSLELAPPGALKWPRDAYFAVVDRQDELRAELRKREGL